MLCANVFIPLAPGGTFLEDGTPASPFSIFQAQDDLASIRKHVDVFHKLMRRYKYLLRGFEDTLSNLLQYINKFSAEDTNKLATAIGLFCSSGLANLTVLSVLFKEHLVKEGKLEHRLVSFCSMMDDHFLLVGGVLIQTVVA